MANVATADLLHKDNPANPEARTGNSAREAKTGDDIKAPAQSEELRQRLVEQSHSKGGYKHFIVDVWLMDLNPTEFGFFKSTRNRVKSRQFTQDMDIYAEVIEEGKRTGLIGYRKSLWAKGPGSSRRIVCKLFSDKLNWRATMELMLTRSVQQTIGARLLPVTVYSVNTANEEHMVCIERSANKWPLMPETFSFFLQRDGQLEFYRIRQDFFRFGDDYSIYNAQNKRIGRLDGAFFSISGKWRCRVKEEHASKQLLNVLKMFAGMIVFNDRSRSYVKHLAKAIVQGRITPKIERQEAELYANPRRMR